MNARTRKRVEAVLDRAAELQDGGLDEYAAAREALTAQTTDVLMQFAVASVVDFMRRRQRTAALTVEREAEQPRIMHESPRQGRPRKPPGAAERAALNDSGMLGKLTGILEDYKRELKIQWTDELLASEFSLTDGTRVTWGDATVEQHAERAEMFRRNMVTNAEGAARHLKALDELRASGAPTLKHLVNRVAA